jgi:hypothetical protein
MAGSAPANADNFDPAELPRLNTSFLAEPRFGRTCLSAMSGV